MPDGAPRAALPWVLAGLLACAGSLAAQQGAPPCAEPEFRQFDFWLGDWDLSWQGGQGRNTISRVYGDCVIQEDFRQFDAQGASGFLGRSWSVWVPQEQVWKQTWVDNNGSYLDFRGGLREDGQMVLERSVMRQDTLRHSRMRFADITPDSLNWYWEGRKEGQEQWKLLWHIHYARRVE